MASTGDWSGNDTLVGDDHHQHESQHMNGQPVDKAPSQHGVPPPEPELNVSAIDGVRNVQGPVEPDPEASLDSDGDTSQAAIIIAAQQPAEADGQSQEGAEVATSVQLQARDTSSQRVAILGEHFAYAVSAAGTEDITSFDFDAGEQEPEKIVFNVQSPAEDSIPHQLENTNESSSTHASLGPAGDLESVLAWHIARLVGQLQRRHHCLETLDAYLNFRGDIQLACFNMLAPPSPTRLLPVRPVIDEDGAIDLRRTRELLEAICMSCWEQRKEVTLVPCEHKCLCRRCFLDPAYCLQDPMRCPICRGVCNGCRFSPECEQQMLEESQLPPEPN